jgi:hypothetical protein
MSWQRAVAIAYVRAREEVNLRIVLYKNLHG